MSHHVRHATSAALALALAGLVGCASPPLPDVVPEPPHMSAEAKEAAYRAAMDQRWTGVADAFPNANRPETQRVRFVAPSEMPAAVSACLREAGFEGSDTSDEFGPAIDTSSPRGQEEAHAIAWFVCDARYPIDPALTQPLSEAEVKYMYAYSVSVLAPCLRAEGYQISDPPSEQVYLESFGTAGAWIPYAQVVPSSAEEFARLGATCPQNPEGLRE